MVIAYFTHKKNEAIIPGKGRLIFSEENIKFSTHLESWENEEYMSKEDHDYYAFDVPDDLVETLDKFVKAEEEFRGLEKKLHKDVFLIKPEKEARSEVVDYF